MKDKNKAEMAIIKEVLTIDEAIDYLGISRQKLNSIMKGGQLRYYKPNGGKFLYFKKSDLEHYMTGGDCINTQKSVGNGCL